MTEGYVGKVYAVELETTKCRSFLPEIMHYIQYGIGCLLSLLLTGAKGHEDKLFTRGPAFAAYPYPTFFIQCPEIGASGSRMDIAHTYDGSGYFPELRWPITTADTQEYVLVCEDPDEPLTAPVIHGLYYGIPPVFIGLHRSDFVEGDSRNDPYRLRGGFKYGANSGGGVYLAPQPARGQGPHRYFFELIALNHTIDQSKLSPMATFDEIARQMEGKIIGWGTVLKFHGKTGNAECFGYKGVNGLLESIRSKFGSSG
ncbi:hypothetical protein APSETT445_006675 [Aspergillus pseudonomiae]